MVDAELVDVEVADAVRRWFSLDRRAEEVEDMAPGGARTHACVDVVAARARVGEY